MADLSEFKEKYPDIYGAILEEGRADGYAAGLDESKVLIADAEKLAEDAAAAECARIKAVQAQLISGHEALIESLMFDGKTTGPEAAVKVLAAEKTARQQILTDTQDDAPDAVADVSIDNLGVKTEGELPFAEKCKKAWDGDSKLRVEFDGDYDAFVAAEKAIAGGNVKVIGGKE